MDCKYSSHGSLQGASTPRLNGLAIPDRLFPNRFKSFTITVPKGARSGQTIWASALGREPFQAVIPRGKVEGNTFVVTFEDPVTDSVIDTVYASTLQSLPGMIVVMTKPVIYASASTNKVSAKTLPLAIGELTKEVNAKIIEQATKCDCNAVLGMVFNVVATEYLCVTVFGTPCIVVMSGEVMQDVIVTSEAIPTAPLAEAHMIIQPMSSRTAGIG